MLIGKAWRERKWRACGAAITALAALFVLWSESALAADSFTVTRVAVDVTAQTAAAAREQALSRGQTAAWPRLMAQLVPREDIPRIPQISQAQILEMVRTVAVEQEKTSSVRYIGALAVGFKPDSVRGFLRHAGVAFAETRSKTVAAVPLLIARGSARLFDEDNPWLKAASALAPPSGLLPVALPLGDLTDLGALTPAQATARDEKALAAFAGRYQASDALVMELVAPAGENNPPFELRVLRIGSGRAEDLGNKLMALQAGEDVAALMRRAAEDALALAEEAWKRGNLLSLDRPGALTATIPIASLEDWLFVRERLSSAPTVRRHDLLSLSRKRVVVQLHYLGGERQLMVALAQRDLELAQDGNGGWVLRRERAKRAGAE